MDKNCCVNYNKIKSLRREKGMSRPDLAAICEINILTLWRIESISDYRPTFCTISRIAKALGVSISELERDSIKIIPPGSSELQQP
jgi:transcriptional regulator with XRE-family HTH domain